MWYLEYNFLSNTVDLDNRTLNLEKNRCEHEYRYFQAEVLAFIARLIDAKIDKCKNAFLFELLLSQVN